MKNSLIAVSAIALIALGACGEKSEPVAEVPSEKVEHDEHGHDDHGHDAHEHETEVAVIKERQEKFKAIGGSFKKINDQLKSNSPDLAVISEAVSVVEPLASEIDTWFPAGTGVDSGAKTEALEVIWSDAEGFAAEIEKFRTAVTELKEAAGTEDVDAITAAFRTTGGTCKSCHDSYRLDD